MELEFLYGNRTLKVRVDFSERKRLSITVHPDCRVTARAPLGTPKEKIEAKLKRRSGWIVKHLNYFEEYQPTLPPRQYISGETHYYLGRQYRLRIRKGEKPQLRLTGRYFEMEIPDTKDRDKAGKLMLEWHARHARNILESRISRFLPVFIKKGAPEPQIRYRRMKKRWGSCSPNGVVMFNTELAKAPIHSIDYVVVHELCHLLYAKHDQNFFRLLGRILPDWKKRKERLEKAMV